MRNKCNVDKPSYDAGTMLLSRLELIDIFPRLMKWLTDMSWFLWATNYPKMVGFLYFSDNKGMGWRTI